MKYVNNFQLTNRLNTLKIHKAKINW